MYKVGSDTKMRSSDPNNTTEVMQIETPTSLDLDLDTTTRDLESSKSHHDKVMDVEALEQTDNDENSSLKDIWIDVLVKFGASLAILLFVVTLGIIFAFGFTACIFSFFSPFTLNKNYFYVYRIISVM